MVRLTTAVIATVFAIALLMGAVHAQQVSPSGMAPGATMSDTKAKSSDRVTHRKTMAEKRTAKKAEPTVWDKTKDMTRKQWNNAKGAWAKEKDKWRACNDKAQREKLSGTKRWTAIGSCMTS
ncbi:MAG: hypothetical protein AB1490_04160 [Pseudomonadota bacterium]